MNDRMALLASALIALPIACSHDDRGPQAPPGPSAAGAPEVAPTPSTTSEPSGVDDPPKTNDAPRQSDPSGTAPISDSRTRTAPFLVTQTVGGTSSQGGFGGVGLAGTGGSIITTSR